MKKEQVEYLFKVGDIVRLKSGGKKVTVSNTWRTRDDEIWVKVAYCSKKGEVIEMNSLRQEVFEKVDNDIKCN